MSKIISFSPEFQIEDIVSPKVDPGESFMVIGYRINVVDESGFVLQYDYCCRGKDGHIDFNSYEVTESLLNNKNKS